MFIGTYVRSLANDTGVMLGGGAYLVGLRHQERKILVRDSVPLQKITRRSFTAGNWYQYLIPAAETLGDWPQWNSIPMKWKAFVTITV
ncbi:MAG: hypothetical protein IPN96_17695 [Anaerolineales bacterium]|nr:hypothetical protein [Anaerolineales bacterium]